VLAAAGAHAAWNLLAKQAQGNSLAIVCAYGLAATVLWAPFALADALIQGHLTAAGLGFMAGSALLHIGYFGMLQRAYATGDLSVVYPLARGTGPVLSVTAAILFLNERPSTLGLLGGAVIVGAILSLMVGGSTAGIGAALATGAFTAAYTVWDAHAVTTLDQPPLFYGWAFGAIMAAALLPFAKGMGEVWQTQRKMVLGIGALSPLAYVLVLFALTRAPVSLVAPVRESSVVIGALLGARVLDEGHTTRRILAATAIAVGIAALAIS
jgi:drug/metabolite transporter (DMT)-like permease